MGEEACKGRTRYSPQGWFADAGKWMVRWYVEFIEDCQGIERWLRRVLAV